MLYVVWVQLAENSYNTMGETSAQGSEKITNKEYRKYNII